MLSRAHTDGISRASLDHIVIPMKRSVRHAVAARSEAHNMLFQIELNGQRGAGECIPREYVTGETMDSVWDVLSTFDLRWINQRLRLGSFEEAVRSIEKLHLTRVLERPGRPGLAAACAVELALLDAVGNYFMRPLCTVPRALGLPERYCGHATDPVPQGWAVGLDDTVDSIRGLKPSYFKVKVGSGLAQDLERLRSIRELAGTAVPICVDANMAWSLEQAVEAVLAFEDLAISWYEEPLPRRAFADYRELRRRTGAKVMLDESLCSWEDARAAIDNEACDLFNIRISKVGGIIPATRLAALALSSGLSYQIGAHVGQMGVLWAAGIQLASGLKGFVAFEGGLSGVLFDRHIVRERNRNDWKSFVECGIPGSGLGVTVVDRDDLDVYSVRHATWNREAETTWSLERPRPH
jgi:L-alanine-DL-glutamate epimerase-like enolase superfamily enzyme